MKVNKVEIVSDGLVVLFSTGEACYLASKTLHENLNLLGACPLTLGDPSPMEQDPVFEPHTLVRLLVGRDESLQL